jgi:pSer/pThr/pTyr-binding forkhead associated (FHA) protein
LHSEVVPVFTIKYLLSKVGDVKPLENTVATLEVMRGEVSGRVFFLKAGDNLIGRWDPDKEAFPIVDLEAYDMEAKVSRKHAVINVSEGTATVTDIGSMNGTFINQGPRLENEQPYPLEDGDELIVGKTVLRFRMSDKKS